MKRKPFSLPRCLAAAALVAAAASPVFADDVSAEVPAAAPTEALDGATLYAQRTCIACHGKDAKTPILPEYPKLAGQNEAYALAQMRDIKSGARSNGNTPAMMGVMHLVTDEEMQVLARWLSEQER
jgi:cytochrome c